MLLKADCYSFFKPSGKDDYLNVMAMSYVCLMQLTKQLGTLYHLFFLVVKTDVDYQVVGSFIVQDETSSAIMEALNVISTWSTKPGYLMVDNSKRNSMQLTVHFQVTANNYMVHRLSWFI